jgi:glycosyltransferase involved in cell wall biosynthesis
VPRLGIVVPCYNEEAALPATVARLRGLLEELRAGGIVAPDSGLYLVDDGSADGTWAAIEAFARDDAGVHGIKLSRNRGHQNALLAGLLHAPGDVLVSIDADLQDDVQAIERMIEAHAAGAQVVLGVRRSRAHDSRFKRLTAEQYYRWLTRLGVEVVFNHADYRLMSRRAIEALRGYEEVNLFLRGIVPQLGFRTAIVEYDRAPRIAGESHYPVRRMLALAWEGVTSFSAAPLRFITASGVIVSLASIGFAAWALGARLFTDRALPGWASTVVPIYFLGGVQLLCLGIIGEYLAKIYAEVKRRPRYLIESVTPALAAQREDRPAAGPDTPPAA